MALAIGGKMGKMFIGDQFGSNTSGAGNSSTTPDASGGCPILFFIKTGKRATGDFSTTDELGYHYHENWTRAMLDISLGNDAVNKAQRGVWESPRLVENVGNFWTNTDMRMIHYKHDSTNFPDTAVILLALKNTTNAEIVKSFVQFGSNNSSLCGKMSANLLSPNVDCTALDWTNLSYYTVAGGTRSQEVFVPIAAGQTVLVELNCPAYCSATYGSLYEMLLAIGIEGGDTICTDGVLADLAMLQAIKNKAVSDPLDLWRL